MIELIRKFLPYILVLLFLIKANKQPLYLLGIPFLMFMSNSIFFEGAKLFSIPGRLSGHHTFLWLCFLWIFSKLIHKKTIRQKSNKTNLVDYCVIALLLISLFGIVTTFIEYYPHTTDLLDQFFILISIFLGYFIIKNWISDNSPELVVNFLYAIVLVNSIAAFLFILHQGLHFDIYISEEYLSESFQGKEITRSFWFMPQFPFFSIIFLLVFKKRYSFITIGLLLINLLGIIITYTISSLAIAILILILYFIFRGIKEKKLGVAFKNLIIYTIIGILGVFVVAKLLPTNTNYLLSRISEHTESEYTDKEPNDLDVRFTNTEIVISKLDKYKNVFGMGPVTGIQAPKVTAMKENTADIVWSGVIFYWGFVGLGIFILIYIFSSFQAFNFFLKSQGIISDLGLMLLLYIISQFIEGFVSWTFLSGHGITTGLWYFAVLSSLTVLEKNAKFLSQNHARS